MNRIATLGTAALVSLASSVALADVKLPSVIGSNMVLQRGMTLPVWGQAEAGEAVTVSIAGQSVATKAADDGKWRVDLQPIEAGGPYEMKIDGKNSVTLTNILVGEVWICSGQSNMQWGVGGSLNPEQEISSATDSKIRLFTVPNVVGTEPQPDLILNTQQPDVGRWVECSPQTVGGFSAVGYFFGRELRKDLDVPIGLINTSWGGTPAESWVSRQALQNEASLKYLSEMSDQTIAAYPKQKEEFVARLAEWQKLYDETKALEAKERADIEAGKDKVEAADPMTELDDKPSEKAQPTRKTVAELEKEKPQSPGALEGNAWLPSGLYNAMIHPLVPFGIRGAIWYQGESNADRAEEYRKLMTTLIEDWRTAWGADDESRALHFYIVQLANFTERPKEPVESDWPELREAQFLATQTLKNVGIATAIDIGDAADIHPRNKQEVGRRLALQAEARAYGMKDVVSSGPIYKSMKAEGNSIRLEFDQIASGLVAKDAQPLTGFQIAGEDRKWVWADATIEGKSLVVRSAAVAAPVAVRYGWSNNPPSSLYNAVGLPALPFRTDDWPMVTAGRRR